MSLMSVYIDEFDKHIRELIPDIKRMNTDSHISYKGKYRSIVVRIEINKYDGIIITRVGDITLKPMSANDPVFPDALIRTIKIYTNGEVIL